MIGLGRRGAAARMGRGRRRLIGPWLLLSLLAIPPIWTLPLFTARIPWLVRHEVSILSGLRELWGMDLVLFAAVLLFAVAAPVAKALAMTGLWYLAPAAAARRWLPRLAPLHKLAMAEVFLVAVVLVGFKGVGLGRVEVGWGLYALTASVLSSLLASMAAERTLTAA